ncbi:hypothetical protein PMAYCL1PPCAC_22575, partial [Pristionchus mayeri]
LQNTRVIVRGVPKRPTDEEELKKYLERREKNNESARKHRSIRKAAAEKSTEYKEMYEKLLAESKKEIAELQNENHSLRIRLNLSSPIFRQSRYSLSSTQKSNFRSARFNSYSDSYDSDTTDSGEFFIPNSDERPGDFDLESCTRRDNSVANSSQQHPSDDSVFSCCFNSRQFTAEWTKFDEFLQEKTGFTPLPGHFTPLADIAKQSALPILDVEEDLSPLVEQCNLGSK